MLHVKFDSEWPSSFKEDVWTLWTDDNDDDDDNGCQSIGIL